MWQCGMWKEVNLGLKTWTWTCHTAAACFPDLCVLVLPSSLYTVSSHSAINLWQIYSLLYASGSSQEEEAHFCCKLHPWFILCLRTAGHRCMSDVIASQLFTYGAAAPSKLTPERPGGSRGSSCHNGLWQLLNHISQGLCGSYGWPRAMCHAGLR